MSLTQTKQKLTRLRGMADQTGAALYERVKMAREILDDKEWVGGAEFQGNYDLACTKVEETCFPELGHAATLEELFTVLREFPEQAQWAAEKYNLRRLWAKIAERKKAERDEARRAEEEAGGGKQRQTRPKTADVLERDDRIEELSYDLKKEKKAGETLLEENRRLREEIERLKITLARLDGQNDELRKILSAQGAAA